MDEPTTRQRAAARDRRVRRARRLGSGVVALGVVGSVGLTGVAAAATVAQREGTSSEPAADTVSDWVARHADPGGTGDDDRYQRGETRQRTAQARQDRISKRARQARRQRRAQQQLQQFQAPQPPTGGFGAPQAQSSGS